jgi:hypothetical protein
MNIKNSFSYICQVIKFLKERGVYDHVIKVFEKEKVSFFTLNVFDGCDFVAL